MTTNNNSPKENPHSLHPLTSSQVLEQQREREEEEEERKQERQQQQRIIKSSFIRESLRERTVHQSIKIERAHIKASKHERMVKDNKIDGARERKDTASG
eukprot:scaffold151671_cov70-Attheya_sp.AAC.1